MNEYKVLRLYHKQTKQYISPDDIKQEENNYYIIIKNVKIYVAQSDLEWHEIGRFNK